MKLPAMRTVSLICLLCIGCLGRLQAAQVEMVLSNGEAVHGELLRTTDAAVLVRRTILGTSGSVTAEISYPRDRIVSIIDLDEEYRRRSEEAKPDAVDALVVLAQWCRGAGMADKAALHARQILEIDKINGAAIKVLDQCGYVLIDGKWVKESDWLAERGLVRYNGQVMGLAERDELRKAQTLRRSAQSALTNVTYSLNQIEQAMREDSARLAEIDRDIAQAQARIKDNDPAQAQKRLDAAKARRDSVQAWAKTRPANDPRARTMQQAAENAVQSEQGRFDRAPAERERGTRDAEAFTREKAALVRRRAEQDKNKPPLVAARVQAQNRVAETEAMVRDIESRITPAALPATVAPRKAPPAAVEGTGLTAQDL